MSARERRPSNRTEVQPLLTPTKGVDRAVDANELSLARTVIIFITFCFGNLCLSLCYSLIMPFFPQEAVRKGGNATLSGVVLGSFEFVMLFAAPVIPSIVNYFGAKKVLLTGAFVAGVCSILFGLLDRVQAGPMFFVLAIAVRLCEGLGVAAYYIPAMALRTKLFIRFFAFAFAFIEANYALGLAIGPAVGGLLYSLGGYSLPFFVLGSLLLILDVIQAFIIPGRVKQDAHVDEVEQEHLNVAEMSAANERRRHLTPSIYNFAIRPKISFSFLILATGAFGITFMNSILSFHILPLVGGSPANVGYVSFTVGVGEILLSPFVGCFQDRGGSSRLVICIAFVLGCIGQLLVGPSPLLPFLDTSIPLVILGCLLLGASNGCFFSAPYKLSLEAAVAYGYPNDESTYAMLSASCIWFFSLGAVLGPVTGGFAYDHIGFPWAVTLAAAVPLAMLVVCIVWWLLGPLCFNQGAKPPAIPKTPSKTRRDLTSA